MNNNELPSGFKVIPPDSTAKLTFDVDRNRFYLSKDLFSSFKFRKSGRLSIAYNSRDKQVLLDNEGRSYFIDKRGYVTSVRFKEELRIANGITSGKLNFLVNPEMSSGRFVVFDLVD